MKESVRAHGVEVGFEAPSIGSSRHAACIPTGMSNLPKGIFAASGARALTSSFIGFVIVFAILYWLLGGS